MPEFLAQAIGLHHQPGSAPEQFPVVAIVHVADVVTRYKGIGNAGDPMQLPIQSEALQRLNFKKEYLDTVMGTGQPCNYSGGDLFRLNPVTVVFPDGEKHQVFEFAEAS